MRPSFPGMDPWLEHPDIWPDVHNSLITAIRDVLNPQVVPRYVVRVESRTTVLSGLDVDLVYRPNLAVRVAHLSSPSRASNVAVVERTQIQPVPVLVPIEQDEVEETYLAIQELPGRKLVTVIEVLSPTNKKTKDARGGYLEKRHNLIRSGVNVEIDLLRAGEPMPVRNAPPRSDYRILISRPRRSRNSDLYGFSYKTAIPDIPIPLLPADDEPLLHLNDVLHDVVDKARYDLTIDYRVAPEPPLPPEDQVWADAIIGPNNEAAERRS